jgi:serine O-acetyltransferase
MRKFSTDVDRYRARGASGKWLWLEPAVWTVAVYRLGNWLIVSPPFFLVRIPLKIFSFLATKFCEVFMDMQVSPRTPIGEGLYIGHIGGVHISQFAVIGKNCDISHGVTIGVSAMGRPGAPEIGDEVYIGPGATLIGKIKIGNGVKVAANTLVLDNVPDGATVIGVPGRVMVAPRTSAQPPALTPAETSQP